MPSQSSLFDILGPLMIGPSSSHTAGAVRLGLLARAALGGTPERVRIGLHGSFASTGPGHGTDIALVAGLLGMQPDDEGIPRALELAEKNGVDVTIEPVDLGDAHPNSALVEMQRGAETLVVQGSSVGGSEVVVTRIGEFEVDTTGRLPVLLVEHEDRPGEIAAVTTLLAETGVNIAGMRVARSRRGATALMLIETDQEIGDETVAQIEGIAAVTRVRRVPRV